MFQIHELKQNFYRFLVQIKQRISEINKIPETTGQITEIETDFVIMIECTFHNQPIAYRLYF
jgi:hypothetical protein